jgi:hypothetical protein
LASLLPLLVTPARYRWRIDGWRPGAASHAMALILVLSLLGGCGTSASVHSAGSENGQHSRLVFGLPF